MLATFRTEFINRFDPDNTYLQQAIRTGLATFIAIIIYRYKTDWSQAYWVIMSAAFLMQTRLGFTQLQQISTLTIAGICSAIVAYLASLCWGNTFVLALYLSMTSFVAIYLSVLGENIAITCFFINLFAIMSAGLITTDNIQRSLMILIGSIIALFMCFLWPPKLENIVSKSVKIYYLCLAEFCEKLNSAYSAQDYLVNKDKYERQFHERRNRTLRFLNKLRQSFHKTQQQQIFTDTMQSKYENVVETANQLFKSAIALGNLRFRLSNQTDIDTLRSELKIIHFDLAVRIRNVITNKPQPLTQDIIYNLDHLQNIELRSKDLKSAIMDFTNNALKIIYNLQNL